MQTLVAQMSLSRLNHRLSGCEAHPEVRQGTAEFPHEIADPLLPQADPVLHDATTLDAAVDVLDAQRPCTCPLRINTVGSPVDFHRGKKA
jgi:hypothetical protein